jgi:hypothetical protein
MQQVTGGSKIESPVLCANSVPTSESIYVCGNSFAAFIDSQAHYTYAARMAA